MTVLSSLPRVALALAVLAACAGDDGEAPPSTTFAGGRVLLAGPDVALRNAALSVDQVEYLGPPPQVAIRTHVDDVTTDANGRFLIEGGQPDGQQASGQYRLTFRGGEFTDPGTGLVVKLDPADELVTYMDVPIDTRVENHLVTPASVITARVAERRFATGADSQFEKSLAFARQHVDAYLGGVAWEFMVPADLTVPAASPTEAVRAAWLLGAVDLLARDMATAAGASASEVNVHRLLQAWSADLADPQRPTFDGNDGDVRGGGLRLGSECPAPDAACVVPAGCATGACRPRCELYSGTGRVALADAMMRYAGQTAMGTGLPASDALAAARTLQAVNDPVLFAASACVEDVDRMAPSIMFELPDAGLTDLRGTVTVRARAMDLDTSPALTLSVDGMTLTDDDGDPNDGLATATIDTTTLGAMLTVTARAVDDAGNVGMLPKSWMVDNASPVVTMSDAGFVAIGTDLWTADAAPTLTGTIDEPRLASLRVMVGAADVTPTITGTNWTVTVPAGAVPGVAPVTATAIAVDHAGNTSMTSRTLRYDATPPVVAAEPTSVRDETQDEIMSDPGPADPITGVQPYTTTHNHSGAPVALGLTAACDETMATPTVQKHGYLLDEVTPAYVSQLIPQAPPPAPPNDVRNPIQWSFTLADDGIGIDPATVQYRVRDAAAGAVVLDWLAAPAAQAPGTYSIKLFRRGVASPSIPALGSDGRFEIAMRARDRLGREVVIARCWQHRVVPAPLDVGATRAPTNGGANKYGLTNATMRLGFEPVAGVVVGAPPAGLFGVGLMEFPVVNPTTEAVFLTVDLENPVGATYSKVVQRDRVTRSTRAVSVSCDPEDVDPDPGCFLTTVPTAPAAGRIVTPATSVTVNYGLRVWEHRANGTWVELLACAGCNGTRR